MESELLLVPRLAQQSAQQWAKMSVLEWAQLWALR
jgi:hypothetical protein